MNLQKLQPLFDFYNEVMPEVQSISFEDYMQMPKKMGLYAIFQDDICVYVGKGWINSRFKHHHNKAYEIWETSKGTRNGTQDPLGWKELRAQSWFDPSRWTIEFFLEDGHGDRACWEGNMIKMFKPFANDECYMDRLAAKNG